MSSISSVGGGQTAQLMQRLAAMLSNSNSSSATGFAQAAASAQDSASASSSTASGSASRQAGGMPPPPPPQDFNVQRSTASMGGQGQDPIASLDTDGDGAVSASEFGLSSSAAGSSDDSTMQALFKAMDGSGDGSLSTDELSAFREKMTASMDRAGGPPPGPPPGGHPGGHPGGVSLTA